MTDSAPPDATEALRLARAHLAEPAAARRSSAGALGAAALAAIGGLSAAWIVVLGPSLAAPASAEPVRALIAAPADSSGLGAP